MANSFENHEFENHQTFFIEEAIWNENFEFKANFQWFSLDHIKSKKIQIIDQFSVFLSNFDIEAHLDYPSKKRYGIINCESNPRWHNIYEGLYQGYLQRSHEVWQSFNINKGVIPTEENIKTMSGWIITGSNCATYDKSLSWLEDLFKLLNDIARIKGGKTRMLGICFGHQALAKAFGGETEKMDKKFLMMKQRIFFTERFFEKNFVKRNEIKKDLLQREGVLLNQAHGDHVCKLPANAELYGFDFFCCILLDFDII